jgi:3'-phosphoadenosine 5'-phosphosulfate sulfotransferase (PAPS reductase)/FAD synthetase
MGAGGSGCCVVSGPYDLFGTDLDALTEGAKSAVRTPLYAMFSGGNDSLVSTHIASQDPNFGGAVHVNTGIGIEQTREFVRETCEREGWPLFELHPPALTYDEMVLKNGFPGPGAHLYCYVWLKERAVRKFVSEQHGRVLLATGVRTAESKRRMGKAKWNTVEGRKVWIAPILDWPALATRRYAAKHNLPTNPVSDALHMSGECLCGSFAQAGERDLIGAFYPDAIERIERLEAKARRAGVHSVWGTEPPQRMKAYPDVQPDMFAPLCYGCEAS